MTEDEAEERVGAIVGPRSVDRLRRLAELVTRENEHQNLIARSTVPIMWSRHILDSVQLLQWADAGQGAWLDIGTGGGFPGLAVAAATGGETILVEPRKRRAAFLEGSAQVLGLSHCQVVAAKIETVAIPAAVISARAVAPVEKLLQASARCATAATQWLLLRGRLTAQEAESLAARSEIMFHVEQSLTDPASSVLRIERRARA